MAANSDGVSASATENLLSCRWWRTDDDRGLDSRRVLEKEEKQKIWLSHLTAASRYLSRHSALGPTSEISYWGLVSWREGDIRQKRGSQHPTSRYSSLHLEPKRGGVS